MVRTVNSKYGAWIATYYDDFNGARAIANDDNVPSATVAYDKDKTHYGNPMNGEAILNPRYRWSNNEMNKNNGYNTALIGSSDETKELSNSGSFEWLTLDTIRQKSSEYEGRAQLQYPDGNVGNKWRFDASGSDAYLLFSNGHDSLGRYIVPLGDDDATFGRATMNYYTTTNYQTNKNAGVHTQTAGFVQRAHLAGVWMGETVEYAHGTLDSNGESPRNLFQPVKSPSGQPFLVVQSFHASDSSKGSTIPSIAYDGSLNSVGDDDVFTVRFAVRAYSGATANEGKLTPTATVKFGYTGSGVGTDLEDGISGSPKVAWEIDLSSYNTHPFKYSTNTDEIDEVTHWIDLDFVLDYTNSKFKVYQDGTEITSTNSLGGSYSSGYALTSATPADMYGWEMEVKPASSQTNVNCVLMLDRAAMYRPLTDHPDGRELPPLNEMKMTQTVNGFSSLSMKIEDEPAPEGGSNIGVNSNDYSHNLLGLFNNSNANDFYLLLFTNPTRALTNESHTIDRPTWMGVIESMKINQTIKERVIELKAKDMLSILDRQIPLWEVGQKSLNKDEATTPYWLYDAQGFKNIMNLGASPLKRLDGSVGFHVDDDYKELKNQRTQLNSAHPIQMYNNEDANYGPDNIESQYEGVGIVGFGRKENSGTQYTIVYFDGNPNFSNGDTFNVVGSQYHNTSSAVTVNGSLSGTDEAGNQFVAVTPDFATANTSARIIYAGEHSVWRESTQGEKTVKDIRTVNNATWFNYLSNEYSGTNLSPTPNNNELYSDTHSLLRTWKTKINSFPTNGLSSTRQHTTFIFDADPNLVIGQKFHVFEENENGNTSSAMQGIAGGHLVKNVSVVINYFNDTMDWNTTPILWVVDTHTPYNGTDFGEYYNSSTGYENLKLGNDRASWSSDVGTATPIPASLDKGIENKAIHAVWMRDLPKSLWFQYHFGQILRSPKESADLGATINTSGATTVRVSFTSTQFNNIPTAGIAEIEDLGRLEKNRVRDKFIYKGKVQSGGNYYLIGCEYISKTHATSYSELGTTINTKVHICNISDDYKHLYLLWADMRNNGNANADGAYRKEDFGLLYPISSNYEISLNYTEQDKNADGIPDKFTSLKVGEDVDIWNINAKKDPSTTSSGSADGAFSKPADYTNSVAVSALQDNSGKLRITTSDTGSVVANDYIHIINSYSHDGLHKVTAVSSNTHFDLDTTFVSTTTNTGGAFYCATTGSDQDLSQYQDWEDKGGAFIVVDSSKFFNLNTLANGGKTGQDAGGKTSLGDFVATIKGYPTLIDNYWAEAIANRSNVGLPYTPHPNAKYISSKFVEIDEDINMGDFFIKMADVSDFEPDGGVGRIIGINDDGSREQEITDWYMSYSCANVQELTGTLTSAPSFDATTGLFTLTDSSATFKAKGIKAGMLIENTTTPITHVTTDGMNLRRFFRVEEVTSNTQIKVSIAYHNRADYLQTQALGYARYDAEAETSTLKNLSVADAALEQGKWTNGEGYKIPIQLGNVFAHPAPAEAFDTISDNLKYLFDNYLNSVSTNTIPSIHSSFINANYNGGVFISTAIATAYNNRLMMELKGGVRSGNNGTFWDSDKYRVLWNAGLMQTWLPQTRLSTIFDINNVPITTNMTTYNDKTSNDSYGSIVDSRGKTLWNTVRKIQEGSGIGNTNSLNTTFSYLAGKDGRIDYRPKYNSGWDLSRDNIMFNKLSTNVAGKITNVRVYYNKGQSFVDYPEPALTDTTKWKVVQHPKVIGDLEALALAKKEYIALKESRLSVSVEPIRDATTDDKMLTHGRYGYIADPYRAIQGYDNAIAGGSSWTSLAAGGAPFAGMTNALDGNMKTSTDIYNRYGESEPPTTAALSSTINYDDNYYFYGSNSLAYAVQIVHVPPKCPLVSGTTGEELRVAVHLSGGTTIDDAQFTIGLYDYSYSTSNSGHGGGGPTMIASLATDGYEKVDAIQSGFYEIKVPDSYDADGILNDGSIVISFNADYCRALLRHRCGDPTDANILKNAQDITDITSFGSPYNTNSIFPLGMLKHIEMSSFADHRTEWYAPRVHITYDYAYTPATYVKLTDAGLGLNNETMVIQKIQWAVKGANVEELTLELERNESLSAGGIISYLFPQYTTAGINNVEEGSIIDGEGSDTGNVYEPEDDSVGNGSDPNKGNPVGGGGIDDGDREGGAGHHFEDKITAQQFSPATLSMLKGRMALKADKFSPYGEWSILGQEQPDKIPSYMGSQSDDMVNFSASDGATVLDGDGFSLPASNFSIESDAVNESSITAKIIVPSDVVSDEISISAKVSHGNNSQYTTKTALNIQVICEETGASITNKKSIISSPNIRTIDLLSKTSVSGCEVAGNTIIVNISRRRGESGDTSNSAIKLNNIKVNFKRAAFPTESQARKFSQFE